MQWAYHAATKLPIRDFAEVPAGLLSAEGCNKLGQHWCFDTAVYGRVHRGFYTNGLQRHAGKGRCRQCSQSAVPALGAWACSASAFSVATAASALTSTTTLSASSRSFFAASAAATSAAASRASAAWRQGSGIIVFNLNYRAFFKGFIVNSGSKTRQSHCPSSIPLPYPRALQRARIYASPRPGECRARVSIKWVEVIRCGRHANMDSPSKRWP